MATCVTKVLRWAMSGNRKSKLKLAPLRRYSRESAENLNVFIYFKYGIFPKFPSLTSHGNFTEIYQKCSAPLQPYCRCEWHTNKTHIHCWINSLVLSAFSRFLLHYCYLLECPPFCLLMTHWWVMVVDGSCCDAPDERKAACEWIDKMRSEKTGQVTTSHHF